MHQPAGHGPLRAWEKAALWGCALLIAAFGVLVLYRSALRAGNRMTDFGVYARAGWAVAAGQDIYDVVDDNWLHFVYPPVCAVGFVPFADAPAGQPRGWMLPFAVSVAAWYVLSVGFVLLAAHLLARAAGHAAPAWSRAWWSVRLVPLLACIAPLGCTLSRGQVNLLLVLLVALIAFETARGSAFRAGMWLAAAACLKVVPAFLLLYPLWRREGRALAGAAAGLLLGIVVVPCLVWGPQGALAVHRRMAEVVLLPAVRSDGDQSRAKELMEMTATDNQSFQAVLHNWLHIGGKRPPHASTATKLAHVVLTFLFTGVTLLAAGRCRDGDRVRELIFLGSLFVVMTLASPVSHTHYSIFCMPLMAGLLARSIERSGDWRGSWGALALLVLAGVLFAAPMIPAWEMRREVGLSPAGAVLLWVAGVTDMRRTRPRAAAPLPRLADAA